MWPAIIAAAAAYAQHRENRRAEKHNTAQQEEFAKNGIQWRVRDAQAAGLHPLFALNASTPTFSPSAIATDFSEMGQNLSRAAAAGQSAEERELKQLQIGLMHSQIGETDARKMYYESEAARNAQSSLQSAPIPGPVGPVNQIKPKPDEVISARGDDPSIGAGTHVGWREYQYDKNTKILLPHSEEGPSETLENLAWYHWPSVIARNKAYYGPDWDIGMLDSLTGRNSSDRKFQESESKSRFNQRMGIR